MPKLLCTDRKDENGQDIIKEFEIEYAQRILDVKHPMKGWKLQDSDYKMEKGKIVLAALDGE